MREWERKLLLSLVAFVALAVVGAAAAGEWIARSIAQLANSARTIGSGEPTSPVATSLREVNDVGEALSRASHDRRRAEAAMRESDMRFRAIVVSAACRSGNEPSRDESPYARRPLN